MNLNSYYCGDAASVLKYFENDKIDLTVTSPPYDDLRIYNGYSFDFETIAQQLFRVTKPGGVLVWIVGDSTKDGTESGTSFKQALYFKTLGFNLHDTMIFHKFSAPLTHNRYEQHFEFMFVFSKGKPNTFNPLKEKKRYMDRRIRMHVRREADNTEDIGKPGTSMMKIRGNVWYYPTGGGHNTNDKMAYIHPATFPEDLARDHILSWSNPGDTVLDPFAGSGTTLKMAKLLRRNYVGIEISPDYCKVIDARLAKHNNQSIEEYFK